MTFDELKLEAEKQGYRLVKITPSVKLLPCPVCGAKRTGEWISMRDGGGYIRGGYIRVCRNCDFRGGCATRKTEAKQKWNEAVLEYQKGSAE